MNIMDCKCYADGMDYIVWQYKDVLQGIFIVHIGGHNKRNLYRMMRKLFKTEFKNKAIYFCSQDESYWRNNSILVGRWEDGADVYRYTGRR